MPFPPILIKAALVVGTEIVAIAVKGALSHMFSNKDKPREAADVQPADVQPDGEIIMTCVKCGWSGPIPAEAREPVCCGQPLNAGGDLF